MARLQGLMFALATTVLVVAATLYFFKPWMPVLVSDRIAIDHSIFLSLVVTGIVFIATNLAIGRWRGALHSTKLEPIPLCGFLNQCHKSASPRLHATWLKFHATWREPRAKFWLNRLETMEKCRGTVCASDFVVGGRRF